MRDYWEKYVDQVSIRREIPRWDSYGNKIHNKEGVCNLLYERLYVWFDGTCVPCDYDYKSYLNLGNANNNTIKEIWHGEKYNEIRKIHTSQTRKCLINKVDESTLFDSSLFADNFNKILWKIWEKFTTK